MLKNAFHAGIDTLNTEPSGSLLSRIRTALGLNAISTHPLSVLLLLLNQTVR